MYLELLAQNVLSSSICQVVLLLLSPIVLRQCGQSLCVLFLFLASRSDSFSTFVVVWFDPSSTLLLCQLCDPHCQGLWVKERQRLNPEDSTCWLLT